MLFTLKYVTNLHEVHPLHVSLTDAQPSGCPGEELLFAGAFVRCREADRREEEA